MPRRKTTSEANKLKQGRGQGHGENYKPFLTVREVPSKGLSHQIKGYKTGRNHHFLSDTEENPFWIGEWSSLVVDIREQFPLPLQETLDIASRLGIKHPVWPTTNEYKIMTTDYVWDLLTGDRAMQIARAIKKSNDLADPRVIEKLEIERTWWSESGRDWGIYTELDVPMSIVKNIKWIYSAANIMNSPVPSELLAEIESRLFDLISTKPRSPLSYIALEVDQGLGLKPGTSLWVVKHLLATRQWRTDITARWRPFEPLLVVRAACEIGTGQPNV